MNLTSKRLTILGLVLAAAITLVGCALPTPATTPISLNSESMQKTQVTPVVTAAPQETSAEVLQQNMVEELQQDQIEESQQNTIENEGGYMSAMALQVEEKILFDFSSETRAGRWMIFNDGVMGGLSQSGLQLTNQGTAVFQGTLSLENYGGFASVRSVPYRFEMAGYSGISLRVLGDGRKYMLRLRTDAKTDGPAYQAEFDTIANQWITVNIPFQDAEPTFRGRRLSSLPTLAGKQITQIGLMLADKQEGSFRLEVDWIRAYKTRL